MKIKRRKKSGILIQMYSDTKDFNYNIPQDYKKEISHSPKVVGSNLASTTPKSHADAEVILFVWKTQTYNLTFI